MARSDLQDAAHRRRRPRLPGCYSLLGDFDNRCDQNLIEIMPAAIAITPSVQGKNAGLLALLYFSRATRNLALGETLFKGT
jgi:hypothetical protein